MKRLYTFLAVAGLTLSLTTPTQALTTSASSAILMDAESGRVLYAQNAHERRLIASVTKLMTALVAVELIDDLDEEIVIRQEWLGSEGSSVYLQAGERITARGLLYGLLLQSGNDAAMAIACHAAGSEEQFVFFMNRRAAELGMANTSFANPSGLNDEMHYSTAYDMALLAQACLDDPVVSKVCATRSMTVGTRTFYNHNKLLHLYEGCIGMKTGYTELAGRTLVSAAQRGEQTLICVTLNDRDDWNDHKKLLDYGFEHYPQQVLCSEGQVYGTVRLQGSLIPLVTACAVQTTVYPLAEGERLEISVQLSEFYEAPVREGDILGHLIWTIDGKKVAEVTLVCPSTIRSDRIKER